MEIGILLFDRVEELDFIGPYEIFAAAQDNRPDDINTATYAMHDGPVMGNKRMQFLPHETCPNAPQLDVLLVPGGNGSRKAALEPALVEWVSKQAAGCRWVTSVCTGTYILAAAGLLEGRRITSHYASLADQREKGHGAEILEDVRYVRDGNVVTSAGVSAGIDMSLWLLGQLTSPAFAREIQQYVEYFPAPPYAADV